MIAVQCRDHIFVTNLSHQVWRTRDNSATDNIISLNMTNSHNNAFPWTILQQPAPQITTKSSYENMFHCLVTSILWQLLRKFINYCLHKTLLGENSTARNRYSRMIFTTEYQFCTDLRMQEKSTSITSRCMCLKSAWRQKLTSYYVVTSQHWVKKTAADNNDEMSDWWFIIRFICSEYKIACNESNNVSFRE